MIFSRVRVSLSLQIEMESRRGRKNKMVKIRWDFWRTKRRNKRRFRVWGDVFFGFQHEREGFVELVIKGIGKRPSKVGRGQANMKS